MRNPSILHTPKATKDFTNISARDCLPCRRILLGADSCIRRVWGCTFRWRNRARGLRSAHSAVWEALDQPRRLVAYCSSGSCPNMSSRCLSTRQAQWSAYLTSRSTRALERFRGRPGGALQLEISCEWSKSRIVQVGLTRTRRSVRIQQRQINIQCDLRFPPHELHLGVVHRRSCF